MPAPHPFPPPTEPFTWLQPGTWRKPCIVHVTMVANARQPLFGQLSHDGTRAVVRKTPIGQALIAQEQKMLELCPEIKILAEKVMPDHHHIVLYVQRTMPSSIKEVLRGYMQGCKAEARKLGVTANIYDGPPYYRVLTHRGQLHAMIEYVKANAERAWQRRQNPDLFRIYRQTGVCGLQFTSMGNHFLLNWPDRQLVEMSRRATEVQIRERAETVLASAHNGAITYTAAISTGERMIARKVREQGFPLIVLLNDGFPAAGSPHERFFKPGGIYFDAFTVAENVADLGGFFLAYDSYIKHLKKQGFWGGQLRLQQKRFYEAYAYLWSAKWTAEYAMNKTLGNESKAVAKDNHSMFRERVNGIVANTDDWYDIFGVKEGDKLYLAPENRIRIW